MVGWASGFKSEYISSDVLNHGWARFCKVKDSSGKSFTVSLDNAWLNLDGKGSGSSVIAKSTWKKSTDVYAINQILCVTGEQWG